MDRANRLLGTLKLDEAFDDDLLPMNIPVYPDAMSGHIRRKVNMPVGFEVEIDADVGTIRSLPSTVL
jgi:muramoyltetrapeptide carboxypeptidase